METAKASNDRTSTNGFRYTFDEFEIDPGNRLVVRPDGEVVLNRKLFDLLLIFLENPNRLLEKDELIDKLWKEDFVEEGNLARQVSSLRKALGDAGKHHKYITTVAGHGYRFVANVRIIEHAVATVSSNANLIDPSTRTPLVGPKAQPKPWVLIITALFVILTFAWVGTERFLSSSRSIKSIAILPLKRIDGGDNYLGIGIADAVIRKISQSHQLNVRPTSAILRFADANADTLAVGRELNTDAVLEGNIQSSADRLRVSINLLRTSDGSSLWADSFDMPASDIFAVQDRVSDQVATRLQLRIDGETQLSGPHSKYPANARAYEYYIKGIFSLDQRGDTADTLPQMEETFKYFNMSIDADPNYALAHAQLAWAYSWTATIMDTTTGEKWADLARQEIKRAEELDPEIPETHLAKAVLYWSKYENFNYDALISELQTARRSNIATTHGEFAGIYAHLGLEERAATELNEAMQNDSTSKYIKSLTLVVPFLRGDMDAWMAARQKLPNDLPHVYPWYYLQKGRLDEAKEAIEERLSRDSKDPDTLIQQAVYWALIGKSREAESAVPEIVSMLSTESNRRHHLTYAAACVYAIDGNSHESVKWLRDTAATGFPDYPLFTREPFLDRIRNAPEFIQFMDEQKARWERFRQEAED